MRVTSREDDGVLADGVLAAIDVGTNSIHLVVARLGAGGRGFDVVAREKEVVRLGSGGGDMKRLAPSAIDRGVHALSRFRQVAQAHGATAVRAVGTSAVREAENRATLLTRARREAGVDIEVISGFEEARLIHLGVLQALPVFDRRLVLVDIGGGSTEVLLGASGEPIESRSFKLGAIRLTRRFFASRRLHPGAVDSCRRFVRATVAPFATGLRRAGFDVAVGSSGTVGALASMAAALDAGPAPRSLNGYVLSSHDLDRVVDSLVRARTVAARAELPGLDERRADIIIAGALILEGIVAELRLDELVFSEFALREGVLLDTWRRREGGSIHHLSDLRRRSVVALQRRLDDDPAHADRIAQLALLLHDELASRLDLDDSARELLEAAALLCNVGLFVSHAQHHKHSYYLIRNCEQLSGFTDREIELIAQIARYHRKSSPKRGHAEFAALGPDDQRRVRSLAAVLRVAVGLDRRHDGRVAALHATRRDGDGGLELVVIPRDGEDVGLELYTASQRTDLLAEVLGCPVVVREASR